MVVVRNSDRAPKLLEAQDPEVEWMLQVRNGSTRAFEQILRRYQAPVRSYLTQRTGNRDRAEDLTQEVFLRVFRARRSYLPQSKFSTWLFTIVNNVATNAYRYRAIRHEYSFSDGFGAASWESDDSDAYCDFPSEPGSYGHCPPLEMLEREEARQAVWTAMKSLNERQRTAVDLCKLQGLSYAEVADAMNISLKAVKSLLNRAKVNLHASLLDYMETGTLPVG